METCSRGTGRQNVHWMCILLTILAGYLAPFSGGAELDPPVVVGISFPRDGHVFKTPPVVEYAIEGLDSLSGEGLGWWGRVQVNGVAASELWHPEGAISLTSVPFRSGIEHRLTILVFAGVHVGDETQPLASRTVRFFVETSNTLVQSCVSAPEWCVSADDLEAEARRIGADPGERGVHVAGSAAPHREEGGDWRRGEGGAGALWEQRDWGKGMLGPLLEVWRLPERRRGVTRAHASSNAWTERLPDFGHFLREDGGELVMLDAFGPGCVFRMFFPVVAGPEGSGPAWRLRVRIDGKLAVDLSVEELSELATPPFIHPLAGFGDPQLGFLAQVPMVFHRRCTVSFLPAPPHSSTQILADLIDCLDNDAPCSSKIYWDIDWVRFATLPVAPPFAMPSGVAQTSPEYIRALRSLGAARDAARGGGSAPPGVALRREDVTVDVLAEGGAVELWSRGGQGCVYELRLREEGAEGGRDGEGKMEGLRLWVTFDDADAPQIDVPVSALFLFARSSQRNADGGWGDQAQSLLLGHADDGTGYLYFPMPFVRSARVQLFLVPNSPEGAALRVAASLKWAPTLPCADARDCGTLNVRHTPLAPVECGVDFPLVEVAGAWGHVVGVVVEIEAAGGRAGQGFYEGDLRFWLDGQETPRVHETGTEDFFNAAHGYAALANFSQALFGAPLVRLPAFPRGHVWHIYRLLVADAVSFQLSARATLEHGSVQNNMNLHKSNLAEGDYGATVFFYAGGGLGSKELPGATQVLDTLTSDELSMLRLGVGNSEDFAGRRMRHAYREIPGPGSQWDLKTSSEGADSPWLQSLEWVPQTLQEWNVCTGTRRGRGTGVRAEDGSCEGSCEKGEQILWEVRTGLALGGKGGREHFLGSFVSGHLGGKLKSGNWGDVGVELGPLTCEFSLALGPTFWHDVEDGVILRRAYEATVPDQCAIVHVRVSNNIEQEWSDDREKQWVEVGVWFDAGAAPPGQHARRDSDLLVSSRLLARSRSFGRTVQTDDSIEEDEGPTLHVRLTPAACVDAGVKGRSYAGEGVPGSATVQWTAFEYSAIRV